MKAKFILFIASLCLLNITVNAQFVTNNDSIINAAVSKINLDSINNQLQWLQDMGTRFMMAPNHREVAASIKSKFESYGITEVRLDSFQCYTNINYEILHYDTTTWQYNVEARITGSVYPEEEIILMGHHDNVQLDSNPESFAPGADDNASGTVAVLETARVLMDIGYQPERTIVFLTTAAEELMYFGDAGSEHYATQAAEAGVDIYGVINNDMIAYDNGSNTMTLSNVIGSEEITGIASLITSTYTSLDQQINPPSGSGGADLEAFIQMGYKGVYLMEKDFNPYYHSESDLVENCNLVYLTEAIKISCGTIIYTDISVGIENQDENKILVTAFPNPCKNIFNISLSENDNLSQVKLYNIHGQILFESGILAYQNKLSINMIDYPSGVYILNIYNDNDLTQLKIIKE